VPAASRSVKLLCSTNFMDARENGRTQTRLSSSVNTRPACGSFSTQDSLEICPLIGVDQKRPASDRNDANMKVCGRRPHGGGAAQTGAGVRKPLMEETAGGGRGWRGVDYGDFDAADAVWDWSWADPTDWPPGKLLLMERPVVLHAVNWRPICVDGGISERTLPWPMERQRARRADLPVCDAVMRCRAS
jgi:hypothetical protein